MFRSEPKFGDLSTLGFDASRLTPALRFRLTACLIALSAVVLLGLRMGNPFPALAQIIPAYLAGMLAIPLTLLAVYLVFVRLRALLVPEHAQKWSEKQGFIGYIRELNLIDIVTAFAALAVTISCFTIHKSQVISVTGYHADAAIIAMDRWLLLGNDGWVLTHALLSGATATKIIDFLYHPAFLPMVIGYVACACLTRRAELRYTYINAFLASFVIIGMIFANLFASAGPVYDGLLFGDGQTFGALQTILHDQSQQAGPFFSQMAQNFLFDAYSTQHLRLGAGISAMPSMHVVMAFLWVFAAWPISRSLGLVTAAYACFIWFSSVHLGWHYFADGLVGLAMLSVIWVVVARFMSARQPRVG